MALYLIFSSILLLFRGPENNINLKIHSEIVDKGYFYLESYDSGKLIKERFVFDLSPGTQTISKPIPHNVDSINEFRVYFSILNRKNNISIYEMSYNSDKRKLLFTPDNIEKQFIFNQYLENIRNIDSCLVFSSFPIDKKNDSYIRWVKSRSSISKFYEYNIRLELQSDYSFVALCFFDDNKEKGLYFANSFDKLDFDYYEKNSQTPLKFKLFSTNPINKLRIDFVAKNSDSLKTLIENIKIEGPNSSKIVNKNKLHYYFGISPCGNLSNYGEISFYNIGLVDCSHNFLFSREPLFKDKSFDVNKITIYGRSSKKEIIRVIGSTKKHLGTRMPRYDYSISENQLIQGNNIPFKSEFDLISIDKIKDIRIEFLGNNNEICIDSLIFTNDESYLIVGSELKKYLPVYNNLIISYDDNGCLKTSIGKRIPTIESKGINHALLENKNRLILILIFIIFISVIIQVNKLIARINI